MNAPDSWVLAVLVIAIFVRGLNQACQAWCVRVKAFKVTSASQVIRSLSSGGMQTFFGYYKMGPAGLIFSLVVADILASISLVVVVFRDFQGSCPKINWNRLKNLIWDYRDFPLYSASMNLINSLSMGLPVLLLTQFYGIAVAGAYAFGDRILSAPMGFVQVAFRQVLFQRAAEAHNEGAQIFPLFIKITLGLFVLALLPSLILFIWAPQIFVWVFGSQWQTAGEYARYLILWLLFMFCNLPSVIFARIIRIQREMFLFNLILLAARSVTLTLGGMYLTAIHTIISFALVGAVMNIIFIVIVGRKLLEQE
jgi:O-antigen/teichoic acid export membrane protein